MAIEEFDVILKDEGEFIDVIFQSEKAKTIVKNDKILKLLISEENDRVWFSIVNDHPSGENITEYCKGHDLKTIEF